jgi:hypothetical protein
MAIKRFDIVRLLRSDRVSYVSGPAGKAATPNGNWIVVAGCETDKYLLAKQETIIKIPMDDVFKIGDYDLGDAINRVKRVRSSEDLKKLGMEIPNVKERGESDRAVKAHRNTKNPEIMRGRLDKGGDPKRGSKV